MSDESKPNRACRRCIAMMKRRKHPPYRECQGTRSWC